MQTPREITRWQSLARNWLLRRWPAGTTASRAACRRAFLLGEGSHDREGWIENRLEELAQIFAIAVGGFSVMDNHLHVLLRLDQEVADGWSDDEVVRRWGWLFPPRDQIPAAAGGYR